ncbi:TPA: hypothetical protein ACH3X1_015730 [Trebouxia sp. C0004]
MPNGMICKYKKQISSVTSGVKHTEAYLNRQIPGVQEVLQTAEYRHFAEQVIHKEADSLQRLGWKASQLSPWMSNTSQSSSTAPVSTAETVSVSATVTSANTDNRPAKRQRTEGADDSDKEEQALLDAIDRQKRRNTLQLQLYQELQRGTEIAAAQQALAMPVALSHCPTASRAYCAEMPLSAEDARYRVLGCVDLNDNQKAELLLLINSEPNKTVPIFTGVPDSLLALTLTKHLEGLTAGGIITQDPSGTICQSLMGPPISSYPTSLQELSDCLSPRAGQVVTLNHREFQALQFDFQPAGLMQHVVKDSDASAQLITAISGLTRAAPHVAGNEGLTLQSVGQYTTLLSVLDSMQVQPLHLYPNDNCVEKGTSTSIVEDRMSCIL